MSFRESVLECLGKFPEKTDLKGEIISSEDKHTHILQRVRYYVEPGECVESYLLIPKELMKKNPAIIAIHQHNCEYYLGKSEPAGLSKNSMYHYGLELCLRGYVVLCPDNLGFEDRRPDEYKRKENDNLEGMNYERLLFSKYILEGSTLQAKYLSDLCKGVDFLETLDFVDSERIGAIGHSLGGQETLWLTWFDKRIKVGVSSCGFSQMKTILRDDILHNYAAYVFGLLNIGDIGDIICDMAPKPFLMTNGEEDGLFPVDGVRDIVSKAQKKYMEMGCAENFNHIIFKGKHAFPEDVRVRAYEWIDRFLK